MPNKDFDDVGRELYENMLRNSARTLKEREAEEKKNETRTAGPKITTNLSDYIILPGNKHGNYEYPDLLVSKEKYLHNNSWDVCHKNLNQDGFFMLTIRQFVDFLNLLRKGGEVYEGTGKKLSSDELLKIYNEINEKRGPFRAEWLDAKFRVNKQLYIVYSHRLLFEDRSSSLIIPQRHELLEECLMKDKRIDLGDWLENANYQGLPKRNVKRGSLYYWSPLGDNDSVARFGVDSDGAYLDCGGDPSDSYAGLGVRRAMVLEEVKR